MATGKSGIISSFVDYFGKSHLKKALLSVVMFLVIFGLNKVSDFLTYRNQFKIKINTEYKNNSIAILKYNQILPGNE